jgi:perosamine synthetase
MSKNALFISHLGMGDMITMCGAVRYLREKYNKIVVVCKDIHSKNVKMMYSDDDDKIEILQINSIIPEYRQINEIVHKYREQNYDMLLSGLHKTNIIGEKWIPADNIHKMFYNDINLDINIMSKYFKCADLPESLELFKSIPSNVNIIFVHNQASGGESAFMNLDKYYNQNYILINPNKNMYETTNMYYEIANSFVNKPLFFYKDIILNAREIYVIDSSFSCLSALLLKNINIPKYLYTRTMGDTYPDLFDNSWAYIDAHFYNTKMNIPIYKPYISKYKSSAIDAINSEWISNHGKYIQLASDKLKSITKNKYCILMNNGTSATQCLFKAIKYKYPNIKKIYISNNVFIAPWNCCLMEYPESFLEIMKMNPETLNIDTSEEYIKSLDKDSVVCIVHNLGNIINVPRLKQIRPDLIFIEDNCEGLFGKYSGQYSGTVSLCTSVSFYGNKTITTGEGGAFFTDDECIYNYINSIYSHGMTSKRYVHCHIATNFRMTNVQAAFLYDQLNDINHIFQLKNNIFNNYNKYLEPLIKIGKIKLFKTELDTEHSKWMYSIMIPSKTYTDIENYMKLCNIEVRPVFYDIHDHTHLKNITNTFDITKITNVVNSSLILPSYPELKEIEIIYISKCLSQLLE